MTPIPISAELISPSLRITSRIAKVRISRLVQNGMVIRNSQIIRAFGGRVAMNHAVGSPSAKVMTVVKNASFTDRHRISRLASAKLMVPSKMSRANTTLNHASRVNGGCTPKCSPLVMTE